LLDNDKNILTMKIFPIYGIFSLDGKQFHGGWIQARNLLYLTSYILPGYASLCR